MLGIKVFDNTILSRENIDSVSWSPQSTVIALRDSSDKVTLIDMTTENVLAEIENVVQMAWSPKIRFFAAVRQQGEIVILWQQANWKRVENNLDDVKSVTWSPRRDFLLVTTRDDQQRWYKSPTHIGDSLRKISLKVDQVEFTIPDGAKVFFSPEGKYIAIVGEKDFSLFQLGPLNGDILQLFKKNTDRERYVPVEMVQWIDDDTFVEIAESRLRMFKFEIGEDQFKDQRNKWLDKKIVSVSLSPKKAYMFAFFDPPSLNRKGVVIDTRRLAYVDDLEGCEFYWMLA